MQNDTVNPAIPLKFYIWRFAFDIFISAHTPNSFSVPSLFMPVLRTRFFYFLLFTAVVSALLHARIFNMELVGPHAWRQTQTQLNIVHFAQDDFNILNPRVNSLQEGTDILRMEFPLFQWLAAGLHRVCGDALWLTRIFVFLVGLLTLAGMGKLAREVFDRKKAAPLAAWTLCFSPLFYYYTVNPLPDNLALCFSTWGAAYFFTWMKDEKIQTLTGCVFLLTLGMLCKLPFLVYFALFGGWLWKKLREKKLSGKSFLVTSLVIIAGLALGGAWYLQVIGGGKNNMVTSGMLGNTLNASAIFDILFGNLISTLPEFLLNYGSVLFFVLAVFLFFRKKLFRHKYAAALLCWLAGVLLYYFFELNAITLVHDYYLMPFLPLLFLAVSFGALRMFHAGGLSKIVTLILLVILPLAAFLRCDSRWDEKDPGFNADLLTYKTQLRSAVPPDARIIIGNDMSANIGFYYTGKKGWNFFDDNLTPERLNDLLGKGAQYLYSDSRKIESDEKIKPFLGETVGTFGSIHVIRLKNPG
ncbi:MAG: hypothetical protein FD123_505 [Bacteroidetes bacterium]|nr:MAG: hypothetical protein FD123_505 [Bacteroidota bacterium]